MTAPLERVLGLSARADACANARTNPRYSVRTNSCARQGGFSLIVSLILLVLIALVAAGSMRTVSLQTRMSATNYDRNLAYQGAEAALREAEQRAAASGDVDYPALGCANGFCAEVAPGGIAYWADEAFAGWRLSTVQVADAAVAPHTYIERKRPAENWVGCAQQIPPSPNCLSPRFRITARSEAEGRATALLQSDVALP